MEEVEYRQGRLEFDSELLSLENGVYLSVYQPGDSSLLYGRLPYGFAYDLALSDGELRTVTAGEAEYYVLDLEFPVEGYGDAGAAGGGVPLRCGAGLPVHAAPGLGPASPADRADRPVRVSAQPQGFGSGGADHPDRAEHPAGAGPVQAGAAGGGPGRNLHPGPDLRQPAGPAGGGLSAGRSSLPATWPTSCAHPWRWR